MIESLYSAVKRRRCGRATTSESRPSNWGDGNSAPAALPASPLRSEAANAAKEVLVLLVLFKVRFLSPPYSNCCGATCLTHVGTEGTPQHLRFQHSAIQLQFRCAFAHQEDTLYPSPEERCSPRLCMVGPTSVLLCRVATQEH